MRLLAIFFSTITLILFVGCSTSKHKKPQAELNQAQIEKINQKTAERVSQRLAELSDAAIASGEDKVRFLASDMYLKASAALMESDYVTANLIFKHLIKLAPKDNFIKQKYAISLIRTGDIEDSKKILEEVFKASNRKDSKIGLVLAGVYASLGKIKESRAIYKRLVHFYPKNEEACIFLAKSYALEKKTKKSINLLNSCAKKNRRKGIYAYYSGKIYVDLKQYKTAKKYFKKSLKAQRDFSRSVMALGLIYEELGQNTNAKKVYKKYLRKHPNDTLILSRIVQLLFTQEKYKEVVEYAERLSDHEPDNLNLKVKLGILYKDSSQFEKSIRIFKELHEFAPDNDKILYYLGGIYQEVQDYDNSITYFGKVVETSGLYQDSSFQIAQMLSIMAKSDFYDKSSKGAQHDKFISYINNKIEEIKDFKVEFSIVKAAYFESLDDNDEAIDILEDVKNDKTFVDEHRFYLAALFEKESEFNKSTELIEEILEVDASNAHAWNFLGYSLLERNEKLDDAYKYIKKAVELSPDDGYIRDSLGWYYYKKGATTKALSELKKAIKLVPGDVSINKHMAIIYSNLKNFNKAKFYIKKALDSVQAESERKELSGVLRELEKNRVPASFHSVNIK
ncbi:MAG: tetratricopeptide repeat protein [Halobacteriovoraceae bacterium]|jgi:tetratricopeptide (TPR) repeat protein|nr:tetratricopeptide repeat protein [Halobacteriovoraceae bacterium]